MTQLTTRRQMPQCTSQCPPLQRASRPHAILQTVHPRTLPLIHAMRRPPRCSGASPRGASRTPCPSSVTPRTPARRRQTSRCAPPATRTTARTLPPLAGAAGVGSGAGGGAGSASSKRQPQQQRGTPSRSAPMQTTRRLPRLLWLRGGKLPQSLRAGRATRHHIRPAARQAQAKTYSGGQWVTGKAVWRAVGFFTVTRRVP